ncbi:MAG: CYTH and CHAD domain-containing protein, partial [Acidimicrobiales bacterium]
MVTEADGYALVMGSLGMERKTFQVDEDFALPELRPKRRAGRLEMGPVRRARVLATYYDTDDLRLLAAGVVLRRRSGAGGDWLLRVPAGAESLELRVPATPEEEPPDTVRRMAAGWVGGHPLRARLTVDTDRGAAPLVGEDGTPLIEIADDRSVAERLGDGQVLRWRSLRLEPLAADERLTEAVAARLVAAGARPAREALPLDLALSTRRWDDGSAHRPDPLRERLHALMVDFGVQYLRVRNDTPEGIHDFRVTVRRMRSLLRTFRPLFESEVTVALRAELEWLGEALGKVRDAEVLEARYDTLLAAVPVEEQLGPVRADLVGGVRQSRLAASTELADAFDSARHRALV